MALKKFTRSELEKRNHEQDAVVIIDNVVYDVTEFMDNHPGTAEVLLATAGQDASQCFHDVGHSDVALDWRESFKIGEVVDEDKWEVKPREVYVEEEPEPATWSSWLNVWGTPLALALLASFIYSYLFD